MNKDLIPLLREGSKESLRVGCLGLEHLYFLGIKGQVAPFRNLHLLLLRSWIAKVEEALSSLISRRQPICLVATEGSVLIASIIIKPNNKRGTCWSISFPQIFNLPKHNTLRDVKLKLLKYSIEINKNSIINWVLKYPSNTIDELSIAKELGFRSLKIISNWSISKSNSERISSLKSGSKKLNFSFEKISKENCEEIYRIEKAGETIQLRSIIDRKSSDFIDLSSKITGIIYSRQPQNSTAIAALVQENFFEEHDTLKIIRDVIWDERLEHIFPQVIKDIILDNQSFTIECDNNDLELKKLFKNIGLEQLNQKILLGKSSLKKSETRFSLSKNKTLDTMLNNLSPPNIPIPSP